jgi:hypothetical protein
MNRSPAENEDVLVEAWKNPTTITESVVRASEDLTMPIAEKLLTLIDRNGSTVGKSSIECCS